MDREYKVQEIIIETVQLFQRYGIKSISMDELSRRLGISKKTLYQHFTDKNDLVEKAVMHMIEERDCAMKQINSQELNAIEEMFEVFNLAGEMIRNYNPTLDFDLQKFYPQVYRKIRDFHRQHMFDSTLRNLRKGKEEGLYRLDLNAEIIAKLFVMRIEMLMRSDFISQEEIFSEDFFKESFKYHLYGIISSKGYQFIQTKYVNF